MIETLLWFLIFSNVLNASLAPFTIGRVRRPVSASQAAFSIFFSVGMIIWAAWILINGI